MKSIFIMFNIFDLLNFHLTFIGYSPLLHLLRELHMAMVCTNPARRQDGIPRGGRVPGTSPAGSSTPGPREPPSLQAVRDRVFNHNTPVQKGVWRAHQELELKPRTGGAGALLSGPGLLPNPRPQAIGPHLGQVSFSWAQVCGESKAH